MPMTDESISALLRGQASQQPHAPAFTFIDCELDPAGFTETLTWSQAHQRVQAFAAEIASYGNARAQSFTSGPLPSRGKGQYTNRRNGTVVVMPVIESSIPAVLEDRARQRPDDIAFTFIEYEVDPTGFAESLT